MNRYPLFNSLSRFVVYLFSLGLCYSIFKVRYRFAYFAHYFVTVRSLVLHRNLLARLSGLQSVVHFIDLWWRIRGSNP